MARITSLTHVRDRRRAQRDRLTRWIISAGGVWVLVMLMLIFVYLLFTVWPLFRSASLGAAQPLTWTLQQPSLTAGVDADLRVVWRIDRAGNGAFGHLPTGKMPPAFAPSEQRLVSEAPTAFARLDDLVALGDEKGRVTLVAPQLRSADETGWQNVEPQWTLPLGAGEQAFDPRGRALTQLSLARRGAEFQLAALSADGRVLLGVWRAGSWRVKALATQEPVKQLLLTPDSGRLFLLGDARLDVYELPPGESAWRQRESAPVTAQRIMLLPGASSLLAMRADGGVSQWFEVTRAGKSALTQIRHYHTEGLAGLTVAEPGRRVFARLRADGALTLYASLLEKPLLQAKIAAGASGAWFTPRGDGLLVERAQQMQWYPLDNAYPEVNWRTLLRPVWFENYPQPDSVWQSTSGSDDYQAKYSLWPVIAGTLKAALYALAFAAPLAIAGAVYSACFMSSGLRRVVKPAIEMTGALPTVVIGLIAGIWLAPLIEAHLLALLLTPLVLPLVTLAGGMLYVRRFPGRRAGREILILLPLLALTLAGLFTVAPWLEQVIWRMPLHEYLGDRYEQRNALVVAIALGFALVPVIFTLAEDALFSVPPALTQGSLALGATPWQTLWRVALPAAGAGIFSALMIGLGRAVGETMIVLMATGNTPLLDASPFQGLRALAANIAIEMPEAVVGSAHYRILFLTALVLFGFTFLINTLAEAVRLRLRARYTPQREGL